MSKLAPVTSYAGADIREPARGLAGIAERLSTRNKWIAIALIAALLGLVCLRSWVFLFFPHSHMDSDQAVFGIMAKDIALGRAYPLFMYGQRYMLAIGSWLCAPLFLAFGISVVTLKLPMFLMNIASVGMLWIALRRELDRWGTALAILPFAACSVVVASRLVEHQGGNIEPIFFLVLAFLLRERPLLLGLVLGIAFLNREFAPIGLVALVLMDAWAGCLRATYKRYLIAGAVAGGVAVLVRFIAAHTPWYTGNPPYAGWQDVFEGEGIRGFFGLQLPMLLNATPLELRGKNITSNLAVGHEWILYVVGALGLLALAGGSAQPRRDFRGISTYLVLVGMAQAAAFILLCPIPQDSMVVRYILVCLCVLIGMTAWAWKRPALRGWVAALVLSVSAANASDALSLSLEYLRDPPVHENETLAHTLRERGVKYATANYWLAYDVSWLTNEAVVISPPWGEADRVARYHSTIERHAQEHVYISERSCPDGVAVQRWHLCKGPPPRAP